MPQATAFMLRSPIWRPTTIPTGPESMVKTMFAPVRSIADSSAVTSVAVAEGCQRPTTSIFIAGRFFCAAATSACVHTAFSASSATLGVSVLSSVRICCAIEFITAKSVRARSTSLVGV
jgi:hypothetical protein